MLRHCSGIAHEIADTNSVRDSQQTEVASAWRDAVCIALLFAVFHSFDLGTSPLVNPDEARYAEIAREMIESGDYVLPRLNDVKYFEKPPLLFWLLAGVMHTFGSSEWALRSVPALFGVAGIVTTYLTARRLRSRAAGLAAALVLGTSFLYYALGRVLLLDMAVSVFISTTLFCFILGIREPPGIGRRWLFYGFYAAAALATLTKGLIGFLLPGVVTFIWLAVFSQWHRLRPMYLPSGIAVFFCIAAPWHVLAALRDPAWARFYFVHEHWTRFTTTEHGRFGPWWYFLPVVALGAFPWTGFLWPAIRGAISGGWEKRKENADAWYFITWAGFIFLFFSKSQSKLIPYILPIFPAWALLVGGWLADVVGRNSAAAVHGGVRVFSVCALVLGVAFVAVAIRPDFVRNAPRISELRDNACLAGIALLTGAVSAPWLLRRRSVRSVLVVVITSVAVTVGALAHAQDEMARPGTRELATIVHDRAQAGDRVYHFFDFFHDYVYYGHHFVGVVATVGELEVAIDPVARASGRFIDEEELRREWRRPGRIWVVVRRRDLAALLADTGEHCHVIGQSIGHLLVSNRE